MRVILVSLLCAIASAATVTIDYKCMPNIACAVFTFAMSNKGIGLAAIDNVEIGLTQPLHRAATDKYTCPQNYCSRLTSAPPSSFHSCFEYPFASTQEGHRNNKCVPTSELRMYKETMASFYASNNIGNGGAFYVKVDGIDTQSCLSLYSS
jgi:hypothetical protein